MCIYIYIYITFILAFIFCYTFIYLFIYFYLESSKYTFRLTCGKRNIVKVRLNLKKERSLNKNK